MDNTRKSVAIAAGIALVLGLLIGFIPEYIANSSLQKQVQSLTDGNSGLQGRLNQSQNRLALSNFAVRSAGILAEADKNDYSVASGAASSLFTDMRQYVDHSGDQVASGQLSEVLAVRDRTIAGLAKADPSVKQLLLQVFEKTQSVSDTAQAK